MKGAKGKTIHQLMLKDTVFSDVLHEVKLDTLENAICYCNALDYVIAEWEEAMESFKVEGTQEVAEEAFGALMMIRLYFHNLEDGELLNYLDAMKSFSKLSMTLIPLSKSYSQTPVLSCWYASLPLILTRSYNELRKEVRRGI